MSQLPADPPLPPPPPGRWPQFSEIRGPGRKVALAFLLVISVAGFLGMALNLFGQINAMLMRMSKPAAPLGGWLTADAALHAYVATNCFILLKSRRRSRSWASLAALAVMAVAAAGLYLIAWLLDGSPHDLALYVIAVFKAGCPLLVLGSLLGLQWLPLAEGERDRPRDGEPVSKNPDPYGFAG
ncbi:MAG: hypothetical protein JWO82_2005 [Akkermansiaceae bacterium]|nr:hypothetical protein [Akkermansiaceae bacterium]